MSGVHVSTTINGDAVEFVCEPTSRCSTCCATASA